MHFHISQTKQTVSPSASLRKASACALTLAALSTASLMASCWLLAARRSLDLSPAVASPGKRWR